MGGKTVLLSLLITPERMDRIVVDIAARAYTPHHGPIFDALLATDPASAPSRDAIQSQRASTQRRFCARAFFDEGPP